MDLAIRSKKELDFVWYHLYAETGKKINQQPPAKPDKMTEALINTHLINLFPTYAEGERNIQKIRNWYNQSALNDHDLTWLKQKNDRLIHWLWHLLISFRNVPNLIGYFITTEIKTNNPHSADFFDYFSFNRNAYSTKEKHELLIKAFELTVLAREDKIEILNKLKERWQWIENNENFNWIDNNDAMVSKWAIDYLKAYSKKNALTINDLNYISFEHPFNELALLFDTWSIGSSDKKLFFIAMKKAYSQKKHRDKQVGKKQCSFNLSENTVNQLSEIAKIKGLPKNHILEHLIYIEYLKETTKI